MSLAAKSLRSPFSPDLVNPDGRPPDSIPIIPEGIIRERSVSPPSFGDGHSVKKGRTEELTVNGSIDNEMVVGVKETHTRQALPAAETVITAVGTESIKHSGGMEDSYASKVMGLRDNIGPSPIFLKDEVMILDEDIITGSDDCPMEAVSELSLFGPWMVVTDRRRRGARVRSGAPLSANPINSLRFVNLMVEDMDGEHVQDGSRVKLVHEEVAAAPRIGNGEAAK
ncbi:hypothetical protein V6N13_020144 [Hibiscus sabdariffa]|uniref:Uncharacterized protein n=1 Tax=Hibiscus sabdariffa TaxID=183260 RepID=A0ABR2ESL1_9ROSI